MGVVVPAAAPWAEGVPEELDRTVAVTEHGCGLLAVEQGEVKEITAARGRQAPGQSALRNDLKRKRHGYLNPSACSSGAYRGCERKGSKVG